MAERRMQSGNETRQRMYRSSCKRAVGRKHDSRADLERYRVDTFDRGTPSVSFKRRLRLHMQSQLQLDKRRMQSRNAERRVCRTSGKRSLEHRFEHNTDMERCRMASGSQRNLQRNRFIHTVQTCEPRTQIVSCGTLPGNAAWNTVSQIKQTWNGSEYEPAVNLIYSETSSETECRYTCKTNYEFNNGACVAKKQTVACTGLPANAQWHASTIEQTWNGTDWSPSASGSYSLGAVENQYQALLQAWYGGQAGGLAVADVLFGDYTVNDRYLQRDCRRNKMLLLM